MHAGYEEALPGAADRILRMAEAQQAHSLSIEDKVMDGNIVSERIGTVVGGMVALVAIIGAMVLIAIGKSVEGLALVIHQLFRHDRPDGAMQPYLVAPFAMPLSICETYCTSSQFKAMASLSAIGIHGGNPVLRWMAGNVVAEIDAAENIKPSKKKSTEKIDGIVASWIMGLDRAIRHEQQGSVYDDPKHGLWVL